MSYVTGKGIYVVVGNYTFLLPVTMSVQAMANYLAELRAFYV